MLHSGWIDCLTQFDYIFIDGDHSRQAVYADIGAYLPFVRPGGILAGHDFQLPDVRAAVRTMLPDAQVVTHSIWESPR
jgi:predicted O-methyltransferase YrrM